MAAHPLDPPSAAPAISSQPPPWESAPMAAHPLDPPSAPAIPSQPPPWEASFDEEESSEDEESEDDVTNFSMGGPPPDMPPPIPGLSWIRIFLLIQIYLEIRYLDSDIQVTVGQKI